MYQTSYLNNWYLFFFVLGGVMLMPLRIRRDAEKNTPMELTSEEEFKAKTFDYRGHQYILFEEARRFGASSFLHNPDCKKYKLPQ